MAQIQERGSTHVYRVNKISKEEMESMVARCVYEHPPFCSAACPLKLDARAFLEAAAAGNFKKALQLYEKIAPFPLILAMGCEAPCEQKCRLTEIGEGVAVRAVEEAVARFGQTPKLGGIVRFTKFILTATFTIEGIGALLLLPTFLRDYPVGKAVCFSLFHSISAFCNAGFDLLGEKLPFGSLAIYADSIPVNLVIAGLIIMGGIGFLTMQDLIQNRLNFHRLRLQTKIILITTALLIAVPTLLFFLFEFQDHPLKERILLSFFQSVTPRTAGFGTCDYGAMSDRGLLLTILLMLSGGAPGSTAGGIKVTTVWVLIAASVACLSQKQDVDGFHRRVDPETIRTALTLSFLYTVLLIGGSLVISYLEGETIIRTMFECASALATVGLTAGMTPSLCVVSKLILIVFMYFGRVGALTLAYAAASRQPVQHMRYPEEKIIVG